MDLCPRNKPKRNGTDKSHYEGFGRLETIKDADGYVLKQVEYHYED